MKLGGGEKGKVNCNSQDLLFSLICLLPLSSDSPLTFMVLTMFFTDSYRYIVW